VSIQILVSGAQQEVPPGQTLAQLVANMDLVGRRVAIEVNSEIVPRSRYGQHALQAGDRVEVVTAIGGG